MASATSSSGGSRSGAKGDSEGSAGSDQSAGPTATELLEKISTLEQTLTTLLRLAGQAGASTRDVTLPIPPVDPETARRQALARLRYKIIIALLGRRDIFPPFVLATRLCVSNVDTILLNRELPLEVDHVRLRKSPTSPSVKVFVKADRKTIEVPSNLKNEPLEPIEIYDVDENMILIGSKLDARKPPCP